MEAVKAVRIGRALAEADLIVIGASNGFDMAEGLNLFCADSHFWEAYGDLAQTDGIGRPPRKPGPYRHQRESSRTKLRAPWLDCS